MVTGTSIKGLDAETALPVTVMRADDIARTGATSAEDLFRYISSASSSGSTVQSQATGFQTGSISTISLRGLTSARTLILINGLRSAPYGGGSTGTAGNSVDISSIPVAAIERVEILKDGASAIYGSDAIAGVVNFILRENFQGVDASVYGGAPTRSGGGTEQQGNFFGGIGDLKTDRYNITLGLSFDHTQEILGASRPFATRYSPQYGNDVTSSFAFPANIAVFPKTAGQPTTINPAVGACAPSLNDVNFPAQCRFDNSPFDSLQPDAKRGNGLLNAHYQTHRYHSAVRGTELRAGRNAHAGSAGAALVSEPAAAQQSVSCLSGQFAGDPISELPQPGHHADRRRRSFCRPPARTIRRPFAAANGMAGLPLNLIYRDFANGARLNDDTADTARAVGGWKGNSGVGISIGDSLQRGQGEGRPEVRFPVVLLDHAGLGHRRDQPIRPTTDPSALAAAKAAEFVGQDWSSKTS